MSGASILGSGIYLPDKKVSNAWLEDILDLEPGYIESTTGIKERRWSNSDETVEYMAAEAVASAVSDSGVKDVGAVFICRDAMLTRRAHSYMPEIKSKLESRGVNTKGVFSIDLINYCAGFAHACNLASLMVQAGQIQNAAVVASTNYENTIVKDPNFHEQMGKVFDRNNPLVSQFSVRDDNSGFQSPALNSFLWGCGAGAVVIGQTEDNRIIGYNAKSNIRYGEDNFGFGETKDGDAFCVLDGASIYKFAMTEIPPFTKETAIKLGIDLGKTKLVPHQPQPRMLEKLAERIGVPQEHMMKTCDYLGNCTASSVPITYHVAKQQGKILTGDDVSFLSFGDSYLTSSAFAFREGR